MSSSARFTENETGIEVDVETVFAWDPFPVMSIIRYPSGRKYAMPDSEFGRFFTLITPQEVFVEAYGGVDDRPTPLQRKLAEIDPAKE